ncbi:hypothetical protein EW026_g569 [Hermanssonia centrifuga]|uniref:AB hydrolase-1 domain-containing protein n=1 Tax=Hermanssonia centrifuga TaxID=98765 RepID=A0A4S4KUE2_9APHY|nr:hypothetical protein EW026_g569 [Hermanssonia centrifuga]
MVIQRILASYSQLAMEAVLTGFLDQDYMIGEDKALDPKKYYIVIFALFSNGESSSPSNTPAPYNGPYFPVVTYEDNVRAQHQVLTKELKVSKVFCAIGFSMGGQQAYYWPVMYPDLVESFLEGPKAALVASKDFQDGHYTSIPQHGIRAFGRVYSAWAYGQTWFRNYGYLQNDLYKNLEDFLRADWEGGFVTTWDANDMLTLLRTWQLGDVSHLEYMIGEDQALDTKKYYIITFALFSNGESSSPSNTPAPYNGPYFPVVTYEDNIRAQYQVLTKELNVSKAFCVIGFSMGGQQAYHWAAIYPDFVERFISICSSARTSLHNRCSLEGMKAALVASQDFQGGHYTTAPYQGIRAFGIVGNAWSSSQAWFRDRYHLENGKYKDFEDFLRAEGENMFLTWDANDMLTLLRTWQLGDISRVSTTGTSLQGDLVGVLGNITAKALIMPCKTDLWFSPDDSALEVAAMKNGIAKLVVIPSDWGHMAGGWANDEDVQFVKEQVKVFFAEST